MYLIPKQGHDEITIDVLNYQNDTFNFGKFMAGTMIIQEKIIQSEDGKFHIKYSESLPQGMYFVQVISYKRYFEFIIDAHSNFTIIPIIITFTVN